MNVDGDMVNGGCNGEVFSNGVIGEEGVDGDCDERAGVMNEDYKSSIICVTRTVLTDSGVVWEGVYWQYFG